MERHRIDLLALFCGLVFTFVAVLALTGAVRLTVGDLRWIGPAVLVALGVVLVASVGMSGNGRARAPDPGDDPAPLDGQ